MTGFPAVSCNNSLRLAPMSDTEAFHGLTAEELAQITGTHVTTARRWLRRRTAPPAVLMALSFLRFGDLGAVSPEWAGWSLRGGELWSPENQPYTPGMVRAGPLHEHSARAYRAQLLAVAVTAESGSDRRERIEALAALENAFRAARAALERLSVDLTAPERNQLFERLDTTAERRARAAQDHRTVMEE